MDEDDCLLDWLGIVYCDCCQEECKIVYMDCGHGTTEFWGSISTHVDWQWRTDCCHGDYSFNINQGDDDES